MKNGKHDATFKSIEKLKILSPLDMLNDIDEDIDEQKMAKLYAYLNADPRLFYEVARAYDEALEFAKLYPTSGDAWKMLVHHGLKVLQFQKNR